MCRDSRDSTSSDLDSGLGIVDWRVTKDVQKGTSVPTTYEGPMDERFFRVVLTFFILFFFLLWRKSSLCRQGKKFVLWARGEGPSGGW